MVIIFYLSVYFGLGLVRILVIEFTELFCEGCVIVVFVKAWKVGSVRKVRS